MSSSLYRGKLYTNSEIKGPFTEAADSFVPEVFASLLAAVCSSALDYDCKNASLSIHDKGDKTTIMITLVSGVWITISEDGIIEVGEGGA